MPEDTDISKSSLWFNKTRYMIYTVFNDLFSKYDSSQILSIQIKLNDDEEYIIPEENAVQV